MSRQTGIIVGAFAMVLASILTMTMWPGRTSAADLAEIRARVTPALESALAEKGLAFGAPVFIRVFKQEKQLEVWLKKDEQFALFKSYPICNYSGSLGPKQKEGDFQSPEGFYYVTRDRLNPNSQYHLSFNLGFPNVFDRQLDRTGSYLMIHGDCVSIGCYAITDPAIEEVYLLVEAALNNGQPFFRAHLFPFRMTPENLSFYEGTQWFSFWQNLKTGYDWFEEKRVPPDVQAKDGVYAFGEG
ncbi:MAG: murein L,D-transpeptidase family protein [Pseudomonadota bacterium]